ncbi:uncharacterized protein [Triticum aestivum]|uniref:uncharacterized protein isoform X2 n=1 Tax=Triticum aestivum TaxID=4565 RepID=UPI001D00B198|nr:uncharacterized protein LOC123161396 isoform X2 [Triticum aestivum]
MAEFALGLTKTAVEGTVSRVKSAIDEEANLKVRVQNDLVFITGEFQMMQSFLNITNKERTNNEVVRTWVRQIRDLAFDVEDCVELVVSLDIKSGWSWFWRLLPGCMAPPRLLDDAVANLQQLKARVEDVSNRNTRYSLIGDSSTDSQSTARVTTVSTSPAPDLMHNTDPSSSAFHILREVWEATGKMQRNMSDLKELISNEGNDLQVISLWGSPGSASDLGTTSIVRKANNDPEIRQQFKCRAWVKLMWPFNLDDFLKSLLTQLYATSSHRQANLETCFRTTEEYHRIKAELMQQMSQERYLIIVEQLSTVIEWDVIKLYLPHSKNASRIVVTTQQLELALSCTGEPYQVSELRQFSNRQCLCAFSNKVSVVADEAVDSIDKEAKERLAKFLSSNLIDWGGQKTLEVSVVADEAVDSIDKEAKERLAKFLSSNLIDWDGQKTLETKWYKHVHERSRVLSSRMVQAHDWITKFKLTGRLTEKRSLVSVLLKPSPSVIAVWGVAGVGKSALVRLFYYMNIIGLREMNPVHSFVSMFGDSFLDQVTKYSWVDVPHPFNMTDLSRRLLLDFHSDDAEAKETEARGIMEGQDPIQRCRKLMHQDRCFVVIDGLRAMDDWDFIKTTFLSEPIKGCVVVITNDETIATQCVDKEDHVINVKGLEAYTSFQLFREIAWGQNEPTSNEEELSKLIMAKCGGLPKVITAISEYWRVERQRSNGQQNELTLKTINANFMGMLEGDSRFHSLRGLFSWMQSYFDACPDSLKPCIFYLSVFPIGHNIRRKRLLRRWIAEGYSMDTPSCTAEENGEEFFSKLVKLSIIQQQGQMRQHSPSKAKKCQVNGFFREYIISRPMQDNLVFALEGRCILNTQRAGQHLTISRCWDRDKILFESLELSRLRSLTVFGKWMPFFMSANVNMRFLRVMDLEDTSGVADDDMEQVGKLLPHLKFLSVRGCQDITRLPNSLGGLRQLQTLDIKGTSVIMFPAVIMKLEKLQYLRAGPIRCTSTSSEANTSVVPLAGSPVDGDGDGTNTSQTEPKVSAETPPTVCCDGMSTSQPPAAASEVTTPLPVDSDGTKTSQTPAVESATSAPAPAPSPALADNEGAYEATTSTTQPPTTATAYEAVETTPLICRPRGGLVFSWLSKLRHRSNAHDGVQFSVAAAGGIGKFTALHTLGVVNIGGAGGKHVLRELKKLTQLRKLRLCGINQRNWQDFCSFISGDAHLESLSVRLDQEETTSAPQVFGCFSDISEPPKMLKTLKVYGKKAHISPLWVKQLHNLTKADLAYTIATQEDIDCLLDLPRQEIIQEIIQRVCVKPIKDGELKFGAFGSFSNLRYAIKFKKLKIDCSYRSKIVFGPLIPSYVRVLVVHCSSITGSSLELSGLDKLMCLEEVRLKGSYSEAVKQHLQQKLDELVPLLNQRRPVLKLE